MEQLNNFIGTVENQSSQRNLCLSLKKFLEYAGRKELSDQISLTPMRVSDRKDKMDGGL